MHLLCQQLGSMKHEDFLFKGNLDSQGKEIPPQMNKYITEEHHLEITLHIFFCVLNILLCIIDFVLSEKNRFPLCPLYLHAAKRTHTIMVKSIVRVPYQVS